MAILKAEESTRKCSKCFEELPYSAFKNVGGKHAYLRPECSKCKTKYTVNKKRLKDDVLRAELSKIGCCVCGAHNISILEVHHLHKTYKRYGRSQGLAFNLEDIKNDKAVVLCANDHSLFHSHFGGKNASFPPQTKESTIKICLLERSKGGL